MLSVTYMYCIIELGTRFIILVTSSMMQSKKVMHEAAKVFQDLLTIKGSHFVAPTPFTSHQVFPLSSLASHLSTLTFHLPQPSPVSSLQFPVSYLPSPVTQFSPPVSRIYCLPSTFSCLPSPFSCLLSPISLLLSPVSLLPSPLFHHPFSIEYNRKE